MHKPVAAAAALIAMSMVACDSTPSSKPASTPPTSADLAEVRTIAKEAYIYGFPLVDNYRIIYANNVDAGGSAPPTPFNQLKNNARVFTPADKTVQTPNSDTPYSNLTMDLRAEPLVLTVPRIEKGRYYSLQLIDLYTHNYAYIGTRATGNDGGAFLVAGPAWKGETPKGITAVIPTETQLAKITYRTQLFGPDDMPNVENVQAGYNVQPLSEYLGTTAPPAPAAIEFAQALTPDEQKTSLESIEPP